MAGKKHQGKAAQEALLLWVAGSELVVPVDLSRTKFQHHLEPHLPVVVPQPQPRWSEVAQPVRPGISAKQTAVASEVRPAWTSHASPPTIKWLQPGSSWPPSATRRAVAATIPHWAAQGSELRCCAHDLPCEIHFKWAFNGRIYDMSSGYATDVIRGARQEAIGRFFANSPEN
eukprot:6463960-Amphidinium_carterae.1